MFLITQFLVTGCQLDPRDAFTSIDNYIDALAQIASAALHCGGGVEAVAACEVVRSPNAHLVSLCVVEHFAKLKTLFIIDSQPGPDLGEWSSHQLSQVCVTSAALAVVFPSHVTVLHEICTSSAAAMQVKTRR
jgi:hypothetical protein